MTITDEALAAFTKLETESYKIKVKFAELSISMRKQRRMLNLAIDKLLDVAQDEDVPVFVRQEILGTLASMGDVWSEPPVDGQSGFENDLNT